MRTFVLFAVLTAILFTIIISPCAFAFTVTPAQTDVFYSPSYAVTYTVRNDADTPLTILIAFEKELAPYAQAPETILVPSKSSSQFTVTLDMPELSPGPHDLGIVLTQQSTGEGTVSAVAELVPRIRMIVPYAGAFVVTDWSVQDWRDPVMTTIMFTNYGDTSTTLDVDLFALEENISKEAVQLAGKTSEKVQLSLAQGALTQGAHAVTLRTRSSVEPEKNNFEETKKIYFGTPIFTVTAARISDIAPGEIGRITLAAKTDWNEALSVRVHAVVRDEQGHSWDLEEQETTFSPEGEFSFIWESTDADYGRHVVELAFVANHARGETSASFVLEKPSVQEQLTERTSTLAIVGIVLLLVLLLILVYIRKKKQRP